MLLISAAQELLHLPFLRGVCRKRSIGKGSTVTRKEIDAFRDQLTVMLRRVDEERNRLKEEALQPVGGEASGGTSNMPTHPSDLGNRAYEEEVALGVLENEEFLIQEINEALARIERGEFGVCEACRKSIRKERLKAVPYARYCLECAKVQKS